VDVEEQRCVGARIAEARRHAGLTQRELAETLGVTTRSIQNYEAGVAVPYKHVRAIELLGHKRHGWILDGGDDTQLTATIVALQAAMERHQDLMQSHLQEMRRHVVRIRDQVREGAERRSRAVE